MGGARKVEMKRLRTTFESAGMNSVRTYINSGNVIFDPPAGQAPLRCTLEDAIEAEFGFRVMVLLRDAQNIGRIVARLPDGWTNDREAKCDVLFLAEEVDFPAILEGLTVRADVDEVVYVPGALLWHVSRPLVTRSGMMKLVGTDLYANMTVRNCNTVRKLDGLMR